MINKKYGLGPQGINAIQEAKEIWDTPPKTLEIKENPAKKLEKTIASSIFYILEAEVKEFINDLKNKLKSSSKVVIDLGTQYNSYADINEIPFLQEVFVKLLSHKDSKQNQEVWQNLMKILKTAFSDYKVKSNLNDPSTNIYEIVIEKQ